jgi:salicylate hydroxylase
MDTRPFLIAGGGIAGLAAAIALSRTGHAAQVFEQAAVIEEVGAGLQMSPNGVRALRWLGAWEAVEPRCVIPTEIHLRDGLSGRLLMRIRLGKAFEERYGAPYRVAHRADLLAGLLATARNSQRIGISTSSRARQAENTADGARLSLDGSVHKGKAVIGADGIRSAIREQIVADGDPIHRGQAIFRALIPLPEVPPAIKPDCVTLWFFPGGHVVHYPVSGWQQFNIVAAVDSPWLAPGWSQWGDPKEVCDAFERASNDLADLLAAPRSWLKWAGVDREPTNIWHDRRIVLVGDAAHATLPYLAQGAVMSLEDACVLAGEVLLRPDIAAAFAHYAVRRRDRTARIQRQSRELARIYHASGVRRLARNTALSFMSPNAFLSRLDWIYDWDVIK